MDRGCSSLDGWREELLVDQELIVDGRGDEPRRPLHLSLVGVLEEEEEVRVERDAVAAAQVPVRPERVEPAVHAVGSVVLLERGVELSSGTAGAQE